MKILNLNNRVQIKMIRRSYLIFEIFMLQEWLILS